MISIICQRLSLFNFYSRSVSFRKISTHFSEDEFYVEEDNDGKPHIPVMLEEVIENLNVTDGDTVLDMTFGAGGHSEALLKKYPNLKLFALDRDPVAKKYANILQEKYPSRLTFFEGKFSDLHELLSNYGVKMCSFDGIFFDLGCSSMQFDTPERGFSIIRDGPLDMRMGSGNSKKQISAADVIAYADENDLMRIFKFYGNEKRSKRLARAIVQARATFEPLKTTRQLSDLIETVIGGEIRRDKLQRQTSVATKVFQALRIFVNNEMNELNYGLVLAHKYLKIGKRAVVLTFHSCEDKIVKRHFKNMMDGEMSDLPLIYFDINRIFEENVIHNIQIKYWNPIHKKVILPSEEEVFMNPRSRSAKLRAATKVSNG